MKLLKYSLIPLAFLIIVTGVYVSRRNNNVQVIAQDTNIHVSQSVEGGKPLEVFSLKPEEKKTALDILKASYKVETKSFGQAGEFVEAIDGKKPDAKHFWSFYINGKQSNVGASAYELNNEDSVEWKLEEIKN